MIFLKIIEGRFVQKMVEQNTRKTGRSLAGYCFFDAQPRCKLMLFTSIAFFMKPTNLNDYFRVCHGVILHDPLN